MLYGTELWGQNMPPLLIDIAHAINRKNIYSLLNNAAWPHTWIPVSDCNSISLNDMVPSDTWFWLLYIIWYINVFKQYISSYPTKLMAETRLVPSQTFPQLPVLQSWDPNFICLFNREMFIAPWLCSIYGLYKKVEGVYVLCRFGKIM
jgi:hypothetical protein